MSFSDYSKPTTQSLISQDSLDNNGFLSSFQEKNDAPLQQSAKLDYVRLLQQEHARKREQMNELRLNHARKRNSLAMRFGLMSTLDPFGGMRASDYYDARL